MYEFGFGQVCPHCNKHGVYAAEWSNEMVLCRHCNRAFNLCITDYPFYKRGTSLDFFENMYNGYHMELRKIYLLMAVMKKHGIPETVFDRNHILKVCGITGDSYDWTRECSYVGGDVDKTIVFQNVNKLPYYRWSDHKDAVYHPITMTETGYFIKTMNKFVDDLQFLGDSVVWLRDRCYCFKEHVKYDEDVYGKEVEHDDICTEH